MDYTFFAMLFYVASSLAPSAQTEITLQNSRFPDQALVWTHGEDGRWAMTINGREVGHFERSGDTILHHTGLRETDRHPVGELAAPFQSSATRIQLRGPFTPSVIQIARSRGQPTRLTDPSRNVLTVPLLLSAR